MEKIQVIVQGDVLFLKVKELEDMEIPPTDRYLKVDFGLELTDAIVALGEVTGHKHVAEDIVYVDEARVGSSDLAHQLFKEAQKILDTESQEIVATMIVPVGGRVRHLDADNEPTGEHADLELPPGGYVVARQRRHDPFARQSGRSMNWMSIAD